MTDGWRELLVPFLDPGQRTFLPLLLASVLVALLFLTLTLRSGRAAVSEVRRGLLAPSLWTHRSSVLDLQLAITKAILRGMGLVPWTLGAASVVVGTRNALTAVGAPPELGLSPAVVTMLYTASLFVAWDFSRYILHRLMHAVPALWELHQVHHSAEVLTPLTYHRTHPLESWLYGLRGAAVTGLVAGTFLWAFGPAAQPVQLLGVGAAGFVLNALTGNLRHSHVWIRFGPLERWLLSPAQHQIHHAAGSDRLNYGSWLAIWDRLAGSLALAGEEAPSNFGLTDANHEADDLLGALVAPLRGLVRRVLPRPSAWAALLLLAPLLAFAEEPSDESPGGDDAPDEGEESDEGDKEVNESMTIVARRGRTPRVAGSAHVIDNAELERFEHNDIHRILAPVPGVYVRDEDGWGLRPNIGMRGANSDRSAKVTLEEDGVLLGPAPYSAPAAYYFPIATRMVGVEVFKGPAAASHGPQTVGGAVNLVTRSVPQGRFGGGLDIAYGSFNSLKLHGHVGGGSRQAGFLVEGVLLRTDGFKELDTGGATGFLKGELMAKGRFATDPSASVQSIWEVKGGYSGETSNETYLGLSDADFAETPYRRYASSALALMRWKRAQGQLSWMLKAGDALDVRVVGYYHHLSRDWNKLNGMGGTSLHDLLLGGEAGVGALQMAVLRGDVDSDGSPQQVLRIGNNGRVFHSGGVQARARWRATLGPVRNQLELGVRFHRDQIARLHDEADYHMVGGRPERVTDLGIITDNRHSANALSVYATDEVSLGPLRVIPGIRLEVVETQALDNLSDNLVENTEVVGLPGLGLHVQPTPWLSVVGGVHRGFSPSSPSAEPDTRPETSANVEAGARVDHRGVFAEVMGFYNAYENLTGQCTFSSGCADEQLGQQFNAGRVHVYGAEALVGAEVELSALFSLYGRLTYTLTQSRFANTFVSGFPQFGLVEAGDRLPYVPEHQGMANLGFRHPFGSVEVGMRAQSAMRDAAGQGPIADREKIPAYAVLDLAADGQISEFAMVYVTINNLTNARYMVSRRPFGARPGRPFQVMVGAKLRF